MCAKGSPRHFGWEDLIASASPWARALPPVAILAVTFLSYTATFALGFVFDDHVLIVTNDSIHSWHYFPSYFATHIWSFRYPHLLSNYYRPLFLTWLRLNDALFGLHPWGWHLTSVLTHIAVTYLVYRLALRITADRWVAAFAGLIFGLHPVHVEAVADVTSIQEPLSTFFILAAVLAYCRSRESANRLLWLGASILLAAAALLSKESGLMLPMLIGGYIWIFGETGSREVPYVKGRTFDRLRIALGAAIPFLAVVLIYVPLRVRALKGFAHVVTPVPWPQEIFTIPSVLLFYLRLLIWPTGLSCYYDTPYFSTPTWHGFILPGAMLSFVAVALAFWHWRSRRSAPEEAKVIAFSCLWMILTLLPVLNFRFLPEGEIAHDRYVYLPSVGFAILVAIALRQVARAARRFSNQPAWALLGVSVFSGVMGYATARQCLFWSDDLTLNYRAHEIAPHNVSATTSLAAAVAQRGLDGPAMALYQQALAVRPDFWRANVNLAYLHYAHEDFPEAARLFARACAADPTDGDQFLYLGMSLFRTGQLAEAERAVRTALLARPLGKNYHLGLGMILRQEGRLPEARQEIAAELSQDPTNSQARAMLEEMIRQTPGEASAPSSEGLPKTPINDIK